MDVNTKLLELVFGHESVGETPEQRARSSHRQFVRSQDELAIYDEGASGRRLSAWEALKAFGFEKLFEAANNSSAIIVDDFRRPGIIFRERRQSLGLEPADIAKRLSVSTAEISKAENINSRTPIRMVERIAQALALDETQLLNSNVQSGDPELAVRLRELRHSGNNFGPKTVLTFDEAAWVISKQNLLLSWLNSSERALAHRRFTPDSRYGTREYPAWRYGYELAERTRQILGFSPEEPIRPLKKLVEEKLSIPTVYAQLPSGIAGATISNRGDRGIVINVIGQNENVWVRRMTIAHEIGHLLWDPDPRLTKLRVDEYDNFYEHFLDSPDAVEARANAFAVEFLAPQIAVREMYQDKPNGEAVREIMERFGISFTSAKYQIWNSLNRSIPLESIKTKDIRPTDDWTAQESYTLDFFVPKTVPESRRGYFAGLVATAEKRGLISADSAAAFLGCALPDYVQHAETIRALFPIPN